MQVIFRIFRARQRPVVFLAPLIFSHHENLHRLFFLDAVRFSFQQPVVPPQHRFVPIRPAICCQPPRRPLFRCSILRRAPLPRPPAAAPCAPLPCPLPSSAAHNFSACRQEKCRTTRPCRRPAPGKVGAVEFGSKLPADG